MPHIIDFRNARTLDDIAVFLGVERASIEAAITDSAGPTKPPTVYIRHRIPKKSGIPGQYRTVWDIHMSSVRDAHVALARRFRDFVADLDSTFPHDAAFGYVRGRGIKDNALKHCGHAVLLRCDIQNFFETITTDRLAGRIGQLGLTPLCAKELAAFATIENSLALGLNASPLFANLVCTDLDKKLERLAADHGCTYTRYADDISISGDSVPAYERVVEQVESEGFQLSRRKMRITKRGQAHFVTGLSITDPLAPHVPRRYKRRLRQELYYCERFGIESHLKRIGAESYQQEINRIDGTVRFVASIETGIAALLREKWHSITTSDATHVSYAPRHEATSPDATFLFDETEFERDGVRWLAVACITSAQIDFLRTATNTVLQGYVDSPFTPGRKEKLQKKGLHFADATEQLRTAYVNALAPLPFRAYIALGKLADNSEYSDRYLSLLANLLPRRFMAHDCARLTLVFEQNPRVPLSELTRVVKDVYSKLEARNDRRPLVLPDTRIAAKLDEPALSVPDAVLGILSGYFSANSETSQLRFEQLRDKYRHIVNTHTRQEFSRRHPLEIPRAKPPHVEMQ